MKCDELKPLLFSLNELAFIDESAVQKDFENPHDHAVYKATEVDAAIAELKAALKESEDARYEAGADAADYYQEKRRLKRALYKVCANWAKCKERISSTDAYEASEYLPSAEDKLRKEAERWSKMERKCRAKKEEYK